LDTQRNGASYRLAAEGIQKVTARLQDLGEAAPILLDTKRALVNLRTTVTVRHDKT
jgi:hypothetical protein